MNEQNPNPQEPIAPKPNPPQTSPGRLEPKRLPPRNEAQDEAPRKVRFQPDRVYQDDRGEEEEEYDDYGRPIQRRTYRKPSHPADDYRESKQRSNGMDMGGFIKIAGIALVVAIIVVFAAPNFGLGVSQDEFTTKLQNMATSISNAQSDITASKNSVTTAINGIPNTVNVALAQYGGQINTAINNASSAKDLATTANNQANNAVSQLATINKSLADINTALTSSLATANAKIATLTAQQVADAAKIKALEDKLVTPVTPTPTPSNIALEIKSSSSGLVPTDSKTLAASVRLTLTNKTAVAIKDVILNVLFETEEIPNKSSVVLTSSPVMSWTGSGWWINNQGEFQNNWGLTLDASATKTVYLYLTVTGNSTANYTRVYGYNVDVTVQ